MTATVPLTAAQIAYSDTLGYLGFPQLRGGPGRTTTAEPMTAAHGRASPRSLIRAFTMNLCQRYPEARLGELRDYIAGGARFWVERAYGEAMVATAGPVRMQHLAQVMANDGHLAELSWKARETSSEPARG